MLHTTLAPTVARPELAHQFLTALHTRAWDQLQTLLTPDIYWTMPGAGTISGRVEGAAAVVQRCQQIVGYGVHISLLHVLLGQQGFVLSLHNTARRGKLTLDEYLATVCQVRDGRLAGIDTYISDVAGFNAFFQ